VWFASLFSYLGLKAGTRRPAPVAVILVGIGYPTHRLIELSRRHRGIEVVAVIDDYPWHHRTLIQGVRVHYPSEIAALAAKHGVSDLGVFGDAAHLLDAALRQTLLERHLRLHDLADEADPHTLLQQLQNAGT